MPNVTTRPGSAAPRAITRAIVGIGRRARSSRSAPSRISALASAIASTDAKKPRCASPTLVQTRTSGSAMPTSVRISPAWFMPSSTTATSGRVAARAATAAARCGCSGSRGSGPPGTVAARNAAVISLVVVLPALPVIATTRAPDFRRTSRARSWSAAGGRRPPAITAAGASAAASTGSLTTTTDAPRGRPRPTKSCPSRARRRWRRTPRPARACASRSRSPAAPPRDRPPPRARCIAAAMLPAEIGHRFARHLRRLRSPRQPARQRLAGDGDVVERQHPIADHLVLLVSLAGDQDQVAGAAPRARPARSPRPRSTTASTSVRRRGAPAAGRDAALDLLDDPRRDPRLRGLSEVTTTTSLSRAATMPISGRLVRSRSPPQPNTVIRPPVAPAGARSRAGSAARRRCARSRRRP